MNLKLKNKVAVVTASGQGIGKAIVEQLLAEGAIVVMNDRNKEKLIKCLRAFNKKYKGKIFSYEGDITDEKTISELKHYLLSKFGKIDILIPNLGSGKSIQENHLDINEWQHFIEINLFSILKIINSLLPVMKKRKSGSIVLISSIVGIEQTTAPYGYAAAKSAILTLVKNLSFEIAKYNIRINAIAPGNILFKNGRWEEIVSVKPSIIENYIEKDVPLGRFGKPEEIASAIVFLASSVSSFTTGACLVVDGGETKRY